MEPAVFRQPVDALVVLTSAKVPLFLEKSVERGGLIQKFYSKLSEKEKKIFYVSASVVILALFDLLFLRPVTSQLKDIDMQIFERENDIRRDMRFLSYRERIMKEKQAFSPYYIKELKSPDQVKAEFLQKVESLATEAKVTLIKIAPSEEKEKKGYLSYYAELECSGSLEDIVKFMHLIDSTQELLKVVKVVINAGKPGAKEVSVSMTVVKIILDPKAVMSNKELSQHKVRNKENISDRNTLGLNESVTDTAQSNAVLEESATQTPEAKPAARGQGITELWNKFFGIKPKEPAPSKPEEEEAPEEEEKKKSDLWKKVQSQMGHGQVPEQQQEEGQEQ